MTTRSGIIQTDTIDSITGTLTIGDTSTGINITSPSIINTINGVNSIQPNLVIMTTQSYTVTLESLSSSGTTFISTYSSAPTSTSNDLITVALPTPTSAQEGITLTFRKMAGMLNNSSDNWNFTTNPFRIIVITGNLSFGSTPVSSNTQAGSFSRIQCIGSPPFGGGDTVYYWVFV